MTSAWFYGDNRRDENPLEFLMDFEAALTRLPHLSESAKCERFYNHCKSDFEAEDWYENLEKKSPAVVASWPILVLHFRVKWLGASPNTLLEIPKTTPVPTTQLDAATTISRETTTTTTTAIPAPANTAIRATYETTPQRLDRVADTCHVIAPRTPITNQVGLETPTSTTATNSDNAMATAKQQDNEKLAAGSEEEERKVGKQDGMGEREAGGREAEAGEQEGIGMTQSEVRDHAPSLTSRAAANTTLRESVWFDWAAEVDEALGLNPVTHNTTHPVPINPAPGNIPVDPDHAVHTSTAPANPVPAPANLVPGNVAINPVRTAPTNSVPVSTSPMPTDPAPVNLAPGDVPIDPVRTVFATAVPADPVPVDPTPVSPVRTGPADSDSVPASPVPTEPGPTNPVTIDPDPVSPVPMDPAPANAVTIDPVCTASANAAPIQPTPVDPDPVNPVCIAFTNPVPSNSTHTLFMHSTSADPTTGDSGPVTDINTTDITPTEPVHVDLVADTLVTRPICQALASLSSIFFFIFMLESERVRCRGLDREQGRSLFKGGALVVVSSGSLLWCQGSLGGFRCPVVLFSSHVRS